MLRPFALIAAATLVIAGCTTMSPAPAQVLARAALTTASGEAAGTATVSALASGEAVMVLTATGLPGGLHGLHLHTTGKCEAPGFTTAGGHLNPTGHQHGTLNPSGSHLGDMPNLQVAGDGLGTLEHRFRVSAAELRGLVFDQDGTAIVVHAAADDYRTDPSGNSGGRIACGVLLPR